VAPALAALRDLEVAEQPVPSDAALKLAELRVNTGLRMPDCCVLLVAQGAQGRVASFDVAVNAAAVKLGLAVVAS
jgi:hypothetical protein